MLGRFWYTSEVLRAYLHRIAIHGKQAPFTLDRLANTL